MKSRDMIREVEGQGWYFVRQVGSHRQYRHPVLKGRVTIPTHGGDLKPGTIANIRKQAQGLQEGNHV